MVRWLAFGEPVLAMKAKLAALDDASFGRIADRDALAACRAGLWLAFDFFEESHAISQDLDTVEGSYWHGILHRREPDAANAKYWFRRAGRHPIFAELADQLGPGIAWNPDAFIDRCEATRGSGSAAEEACRRVQQREWELLFGWCFTRAVGL